MFFENTINVLETAYKMFFSNQVVGSRAGLLLLRNIIINRPNVTFFPNNFTDISSKLHLGL